MKINKISLLKARCIEQKKDTLYICFMTILFSKTRSYYTPYIIWITCILILGSCASKKKVADRKAPSYKKERAYTPPPKRNETRSSVHSTESETSYASPVDKVIDIARSYTGVPYRWGGTTRSGMDCSGLLMTSFNQADLSIPRTTSEQVKIGKGVSLFKLQPGDLVFFAAKKSNPNKITHVGMVTEVKGKHDVRFIHASTKLGVVENNIYSDYYRRIFIKARRPF